MSRKDVIAPSDFVTLLADVKVRIQASQTRAVLAVNAELESIRAIDEYARRDTARAVNVGLTLRNWSIGLYISRYELRGEDRAQYGDELFDRLADGLTRRGVRSCDRRQLYRYRDFYQTYPQILEARTPERRAFELVFVYNHEYGTLEMFARGGKKVNEPLQDIFCRVILDEELGPEDRDSHPYELNGLIHRSFEFPTDPEDGIESVRRVRHAQ